MGKRGPKPGTPKTEEHKKAISKSVAASRRREAELARLGKKVKDHGHAVLDVLFRYRGILEEHGVEPFIKELPTEEANKVRAAYKQAGPDGAVWSMFGAVAKKLLLKDAEMLDTVAVAERYEKALAAKDARIAELERERRLPEATIRALRQKELYRATAGEPEEIGAKEFSETPQQRDKRLNKFFNDLRKGAR